MSEVLPTVIIKGQDGKSLIINLSDFDKEKHELFTEEKKKTKLSIVEKDGKFIIMDSEENQVGAEFYATKEEAKEMLKLFTGK